MLISKFNLYKAEWLDLVFEKRNKNYGAYELRSHYAETMFKAILVTVFVVAAGVLILTILTKKPKTIDTMHTTVVDLTKIMQPPPAKPVKHITPPATTASKTQIKTVLIPTHVVANPVRPIEPPTIAEINQSAIGTENHKGDNPDINIPVNVPGDGVDKGITESAPDNAIYPLADVAPEPFGGMAGWTKFLQRNMRYPDTEVQGRVVLSFVVERDGSLTDIKLIKGVDPKLDEEALRVLKIAPKWKPGLQSNKPVRVPYTIPINFQLNN